MISKYEKPLIIFLAFFLLSLSMFQIAYRYKIAPSDREYLGYHEFYTDDYSIYVSNIYQGQYGRWTLLDKHTSEPHKGTIIHNEYLLWGKLTGLFKIGPIISYHLFRFSMGFILLMVVYLFLKVLFPDNVIASPKGVAIPSESQFPTGLLRRFTPRNDNSTLRILSFLFILFSFGFPKAAQTAPGTDLWYMSWLTELDVFARFVALPHYLLGNIFFLLNVIIFFKFSPRISLIFLLSLTSILAALVHPVSVVSLAAYYAVFIFISIFLTIFQNFGAAKCFFSAQRVPPKAGMRALQKIFANQNFLKNEILAFLITVISAAPVILYYKFLMTIPPWNHMAAWEGVSKYDYPLSDYIGALGPNFFLAPLGLIFAIRNWKIRNWLFLLSWILGFFLLIFFSYPFLHISEVRLMQTFIFIPFAILSAYAVISISKIISKNNFRLVIGTWCLVLFLISFPSYYKSFKNKLFYYSTDFSLAFEPKEWMKGLYYLRDSTPKNSVVLAAYQAATTIPFVSGNTVYTGHLWATLDRERKEPLRDKFLSNKMTEKEAYDFFKNEKIDYFFNGYQEAGMGAKPQNYKFLKLVFSSPMAFIYQFQPN